jgi:hypothetical protein
VRAERVLAARIDLLEAYVDTYLTQEIRAEALVRSLESFSRFLEVAALANGQVTNVAGLARDSAVARPTVQGYFKVLTDTLLGSWLPAWRPRVKVKEVQHPRTFSSPAGASGQCRTWPFIGDPGIQRVARAYGVFKLRRHPFVLSNPVRVGSGFHLEPWQA